MEMTMDVATTPDHAGAVENLSSGFFRARSASIVVSLIGLAMSSFSLVVLVRKYLARRDVFDVGLIILEASQAIYCLLCSATFCMDLAVQLVGTYNTEPFKTIYEVLFALVLVALLNRNQWTMCMTLFRTVAATNPIAFRYCFTKRMQVLVFVPVLILSVLVGSLYMPGLIHRMDKQALLLVSRIFQSYVPVPVILICSFIMAYKFCRTKEQLTSSDSIVTSRTGGAVGSGGTTCSEVNSVGGASGEVAGPSASCSSAAVGGGNIIGSSGGNGTAASLRRNSRVATAIVLCLSVSFHLLETPGAILIMLNLSLTSSMDWFYALNDTLVSLDSAAHFLIFFGLSRNFRRTAAQACCGHRRRSRAAGVRRVVAGHHLVAGRRSGPGGGGFAGSQLADRRRRSRGRELKDESDVKRNGIGGYGSSDSRFNDHQAAVSLLPAVLPASSQAIEMVLISSQPATPSSCRTSLRLETLQEQ